MVTSKSRMILVRSARFQHSYAEKVGHTRRSSSEVNYPGKRHRTQTKEVFRHKKYVGRKSARKARARR